MSILRLMYWVSRIFTVIVLFLQVQQFSTGCCFEGVGGTFQKNGSLWVGDYIFFLKWNNEGKLFMLINVSFHIVITMKGTINNNENKQNWSLSLPTGWFVFCDWPLVSFLLVTCSNCISASSGQATHFMSSWLVLVNKIWGDVTGVTSTWNLLKNSLVFCYSFLLPRQPALSKRQKRQQPGWRQRGTELRVVQSRKCRRKRKTLSCASLLQFGAITSVNWPTLSTLTGGFVLWKVKEYHCLLKYIWHVMLYKLKVQLKVHNVQTHTQREGKKNIILYLFAESETKIKIMLQLSSPK